VALLNAGVIFQQFSVCLFYRLLALRSLTSYMKLDASSGKKLDEQVVIAGIHAKVGLQMHLLRIFSFHRDRTLWGPYLLQIANRSSTKCFILVHTSVTWLITSSKRRTPSTLLYMLSSRRILGSFVLIVHGRLDLIMSGRFHLGISHHLLFKTRRDVMRLLFYHQLRAKHFCEVVRPFCHHLPRKVLFSRYPWSTGNFPILHIDYMLVLLATAVRGVIATFFLIKEANSGSAHGTPQVYHPLSFIIGSWHAKSRFQAVSGEESGAQHASGLLYLIHHHDVSFGINALVNEYVASYLLFF
jgi:hypothetical protein